MSDIASFFNCKLATAVALVLLLSPGISSAAPETCEIITSASSSLAEAKSTFASACSDYSRRDCDPVAGGGWYCSSEVIGSAAPALTTVPATATDSAVCFARAGGNRLAAIEHFALDCPGLTRRDCDPGPDDNWRCSSGIIGSHAPRTGFPTQQAVPVTPQPDNLDIVMVGEPEPDTDTEEVPDRSAGRLSSGDLLVLHYDNCPDRDDGHALAAGKAVVSYMGLNMVQITNGTCGNDIRHRFKSASNRVASAVWGSGYLDASGNRADAITTAANTWATAIANGQAVWVAEGGPSDFTADVMRRIQRDYGSADLKQLHIVQHSGGNTRGSFNENHTDTANLRYIKSTADYRLIDNGNYTNGTARLNKQSSSFVKTARSGPYSAEWNAAFNYLNPDCNKPVNGCKLDFSDTVELLFIVGDNDTRTVEDFAKRYLK